jgi:hypothetical protein
MCKSKEFASVTGLEAAIGNVRDAVALIRRRGGKTEHAIVDVAGLFQLTPKRVKSLFYRDGIWRLACDEVARIEARFCAHLDREIALSVEYTEALRAKRNELTGREQCKNANSPNHGYGSSSLDGHSVRAA